MIHSDIKRFSIDGQVSGAHLTTIRDKFERWLLVDMRDEGYVPHLDLLPPLTIEWEKDDVYRFELSMYGVYVGDEANNYEGMSDGRLIYRSSNRGSVK